MKTALKMTAICLLMSSAAFAQDGFFIQATARTNDVVNSPTVGVIQPEIGVMTKHVGFSLIGYTDTKAQTDKVLAYGAKLYVPLFRVDELRFMLGAEALYLDKERRAWRKWAFTPEFSVSTPIIGRLSGAFAVLGFYHREVFKQKKVLIDRWRICEPGAAFKLAYSFGKKK